MNIPVKFGAALTFIALVGNMSILAGCSSGLTSTAAQTRDYSAPSPSDTHSAPARRTVVAPSGKDLSPDDWCRYVWDKADLASFVADGTDSPADPPTSNVQDTGDVRALLCTSSGIILTRGTFSSAEAAQAALQKYNDSALSKIHVGEESSLTINGVTGDYAYVAGTDTLTSFNFGNGFYDGTQEISVTLVVNGTPPTREAGKAKIEEVVRLAAAMELPEYVGSGGE